MPQFASISNITISVKTQILPVQSSTPADVDQLSIPEGKFDELARLWEDQGRLTINDLRDVLRDEATDVLELLIGRLHDMGIEVVRSGSAEVVPKDVGDEEAEVEVNAGTKVHARYDPVQLYFKEMSRVPLLTAAQEVEIAKQIEKAESKVLELLSRYEFTARSHVNLARKLLEGRERFESAVLARFVVSKEEHLKQLRTLCDQVEEIAGRCTAANRRWVESASAPDSERAFAEFEAARASLCDLYPKFLFGRKVIDEVVSHAEDAHRVMNLWRPEAQRATGAEEAGPVSSASGHAARMKEQFIRAWISPEEFLADYRELGLLLKDAAKAKSRMVEASLRLVVSIAKRFSTCGQPLLDLIQEGNIGLVKAVDRYDYRRGSRFSTYATWWITQEISRSIANTARTIRIPVHMIGTINKLMGVQRQLGQEWGREPTPEELAQEIDLPAERVRAILKTVQQPISLHTPISGSETESIGEFVVDESAENPSDTAANALIAEKLHSVLQTLSERERYVLEQRFGLRDGTVRTLEEVSRHFNVTRERIRQIEANALQKMRHPIRCRQLAGCIGPGARCKTVDSIHNAPKTRRNSASWMPVVKPRGHKERPSRPGRAKVATLV